MRPAEMTETAITFGSDVMRRNALARARSCREVVGTSGWSGVAVNNIPTIGSPY